MLWLTTDILRAIILGIVEGLTEFLPVSSTAHLIIAGQFLEFTDEKAQTFEIFIQLGAILAVVVLYFPRFLALLDFSPSSAGKQEFKGKQAMGKLFVACLPAFFFGALLHKTIKHSLMHPLPVALALIFGGLVMLLVERSPRTFRVHSLEDISYRQSLIIGLFQCFSLWPGISRSGSTIVGALLLGINRTTGAEFSFLVAVPVMIAATSFDLLKSLSLLHRNDVTIFAIGFVVSFVTALGAIKFFIGLLRRYTLRPYGYYRIVVGVGVLVWVAFYN